MCRLARTDSIFVLKFVFMDFVETEQLRSETKLAKALSQTKHENIK